MEQQTGGWERDLSLEEEDSESMQELSPLPLSEMQSRAPGPGKRYGPTWKLRRGNIGRGLFFIVGQHRRRSGLLDVISYEGYVDIQNNLQSSGCWVCWHKRGPGAEGTGDTTA